MRMVSCSSSLSLKTPYASSSSASSSSSRSSAHCINSKSIHRSCCSTAGHRFAKGIPPIRMDSSKSFDPVVTSHDQSKDMKNSATTTTIAANGHGRPQVINGANAATSTSSSNVQDHLGTFPWVPEGSVAAISSADQQIPASEIKQGLGIKNFLKDKKILITGATGFLAKVLVEKILRTQPDVGQLYLLINSKTSQNAQERLRKEIQNSKLFQILQDKHGDEYEEFIESKLTAVAGNMRKNNVGIEDEKLALELMNQVDVVVNSAATTNFIERYDVALDINTKGPLHLLQFARKCRRLKLFLHVSTAYVNGKRVGRALEKPFVMDESIARDSLGEDSAPQLSVSEEIESVQRLIAAAPAHDKDEVTQQTNYMKELGLKRAAMHGWQDTYVFTKAMGEMLVCDNRGDAPVVILRPTVVEGTFNQPFSGWMEGIRMMDPILLTYGKGQTSSFYVDPNGVLDVVPADMVVNSILASMAKHAGRGASLHVYQVGSSVVNPLTFDKLAKYTYEHFRSQPFVDQKGNPVMIPRMTFITNKYSLFIYNYLQFGLPVLLAKLFPWTQREDTQRRLKYLSYASQRVKQLIDTYSAYTFYKGRFDISNLQKLHKELSAEEREEFGFAIWTVEWEKYIKNVHLPGLRKYTLEGNTAFRL